MNRPPASSVVVSVVLAALMGFVVVWFEQPVLPPPAQNRPVVTEPPPPAPSEAASCDEVEGQMRVVVEQSRACSIDADCAIFDYGYPIECLMSVARSSIPVLRREFERYHESCEYRVYYDCPTGDMQRLAVCRNSRCEVDIVSADSLREETMNLLRQ